MGSHAAMFAGLISLTIIALWPRLDDAPQQPCKQYIRAANSSLSTGLDDVVENVDNIESFVQQLVPNKVVTIGGKDVRVHSPADGTSGARMWSDFWVRQATGAWEPETYFAFKTCIIPGKTVVIDFGSWIGPTVIWSALIGAAAVYSFEPNPLAYSELALNIKLNGFKNVKLHQACISPSGGTLPLYFREGSSVSSTYDMKDAQGRVHSRVLNVSCFTLGDVVRHYNLKNKSMFVKIDIEGFEKDLIPSLAAFFLEHRPTVHLSIHGGFQVFTDRHWADMAAAISVFPLVYRHNTGISFSQVRHADIEREMKHDARKYFEMVLTWPGACPGFVGAG